MSENETRNETVVHYEDGHVEHGHKGNDTCCAPNTEVKVINNAPARKEFLTMPMAVLLAGALIAGAIVMKKPSDSAAAVPNFGDVDTALLEIQKDDHVLGNKDANVVIVEWSDTECPFCKRHHETVNKLMQKYDGKIAYVFRHYNLPFHTKAPKESEAQECAWEQGGDAKFFEYTNKVFEVTPANNGLDEAQLPVIAKDVGLNVEKFNECLSSGRMKSRVERDQKNGEDAGVQGTPHTVIWDKKSGFNKALVGAQPITEFEKLLKKLGL